MEQLIAGDVLREVLLPLLEGVRKNPGGFMARCPAHDDAKASLSIGIGKDQPVVLKCFAGCESEDILAKVGLTWADLSKPRERKADGDWTPHGPALAVYRYVDEQGELLFEVCRAAGKQFPCRVPDPSRKSGWNWKLGNTRRVLYRLPQVIEGIQDGCDVWITEGEKDVHTLEARGLVATCNPGGAGKWRPEYAEVFRDAIVTVVADADEPGQAHARQVAASLEGVAASVRIVEASEGKDITDHLSSGKTLAEVVVTSDSMEPMKPDLAPDLHEFLAVVDPPRDWVIPDLLERGDRLIWTGFEGLGKSVVLRQIAIAAAAGVHPFSGYSGTPARVLYIDLENSERQGRRHFRNLERVAASRGRRVPDGGIRLIHKPAGIDLTRDDAAWLLERVTAHHPDLLVIGPIYRMHAADTNDEQAARKVVQALDAARTKVDCALIAEAHAGHGEHGKNRSVRPFGSSLFLRWPELGLGIVPATDEDPCRHVKVKPWRGARDEYRWPRELQWSVVPTDFPWIDPNANRFNALPRYDEEGA